MMSSSKILSLLLLGLVACSVVVIEDGDDSSTTEGEEGEDSTGNVPTTTNDSQPQGPHCGDSILQEDRGEGCDLGADNNEHGLCTDQCQLATCGDGKVFQGGLEECDNGVDWNGDDQTCTDECKFNVCGDGNVGPGEVCDPGQCSAEEGDCSPHNGRCTGTNEYQLCVVSADDIDPQDPPLIKVCVDCKMEVGGPNDPQ